MQLFYKIFLKKITVGQLKAQTATKQESKNYLIRQT